MVRTAILIFRPTFLDERGFGFSEIGSFWARYTILLRRALPSQYFCVSWHRSQRGYSMHYLTAIETELWVPCISGLEIYRKARAILPKPSR
jgi:hypothetical protein